MRKEIVSILRSGGIGVMPTDTIYGIVGSALQPKTVERIYKLRRRNPKKPMIILIGTFSDLKIFGVKLDVDTRRLLKKFWPGKVSVILRIANGEGQMAKWKYLHRGTKTLAFRMPKPLRLRRLLQKTGPLVAPSANWEGKPPAYTIKEARKYFKDRVDFYVDAARLHARSSTLIKIGRGKIVVLRKGAIKI